MNTPRARVLAPDGVILGEMSLVADMVIGQPQQAHFRPASYEMLFRAHIAVMRATRMPDKDSTKPAKMRKAKRERLKAVRMATAEYNAAQNALRDYNIVLANTDINAEAKADAELNYATHTHSKH